MRRIFDIMESVLQDGRQWAAGTEKVSLADVQAVWVFDWQLELNGLDPNLFSDKTYPKTYAWIYRFRAALKAAKAAAEKPMALKGPDAARFICSASFTDKCTVDGSDPLDLEEGQLVEFWPVDSGFNHRDQGPLVKLTKDEIAISLKTRLEGKDIRLHAPRWGFRIRAVEQGAAKL